MKNKYIHIYLKHPYHRKWGVLKELLESENKDVSQFFREQIDRILSEYKEKDPLRYEGAVKREHDKAKAEANAEYEREYGHPSPEWPPFEIPSKQSPN